MLSASEMNKQAEKELDTFVTNLLKINGVAEYIGIDDDTYNYVKQEYIKKFYPIVHDLTFKLLVSNIWNK